MTGKTALSLIGVSLVALSLGACHYYYDEPHGYYDHHHHGYYDHWGYYHDYDRDHRH
jgi:hypothetical protein